MRLICPHCQQPVTLPDAAAGHPTPCPQCGQTVTPPALTGAAIDAAPEPTVAPRPVPPAPAPVIRERSPEPVITPSVGATRTAGDPWLRITLRRDVAHWLAPVGLVLVFV